jgi:hypothetical protein
MAKLRMTYKNLKALRKSKEYQAVLVDLVNVGVVPKATAEKLLGYNIPANLITDDESSGTDDPINDNPESGGGSGGEQGSGGEGSGTETEIELPVIVYGSGGSFVPVQVGTVKVSADNINSVLTYPFNDPWFTSNENWSSDYSNSDLYTINTTAFGTDDATIEISESDTAADIFAQLDPETVSLYVEMATSSSSSSS